MLVHRHAAPVINDGQAVAFLQQHLDAVGMAGHRFVHRVVENFGGEVMQGAVIRTADIHAGAATDGFQPLQHLDRGGIVIAVASGHLFKQVITHGVDIGTGNPGPQAALRNLSGVRSRWVQDRRR